jgi:hypothetical protein
MSTLDVLHDQSMEKAFFADLERREGNEGQAVELFKKALALERKAINAMTNPVEPTWSILHRSAGWLALDCNQPHLAEQLACIALAGSPPSGVAQELQASGSKLTLYGILIGFYSLFTVWVMLSS